MIKEFEQGVPGYSPQVASPQNADVRIENMKIRLAADAA